MSKKEINSTLSQSFEKFSKHCSIKSSSKPFSLRLTDEERALLKDRAGSRPLGAYIRDVVLKDASQKRKSFRQPRIDETQAASLLAALGHSRLSSNINQLAKASNMGTIDVSLETDQHLQEASMAILAMRAALFTALGLKS